MVIIIKKFLFFFCLLFLFNTLELDSYSDKVLIYDKNDIYLEDVFNIYYGNINSKKLKEALDVLNIRLLSVTVDGEKYYSDNIDKFMIDYNSTKSLEDKIFFEEYGVGIESISVVCQIDELNKLYNLTYFF